MVTVAAVATPLASSATLWAAVIGGAFALIAAVLAAVNAYQSRIWVRREQYWTRFSWACEKSVSRVPGESEMGLSVLNALLNAPWTKDEDNEMAIGVINVVLADGGDGDEDSEGNTSDGGRA
jgi:hypothetical protein